MTVLGLLLLHKSGKGFDVALGVHAANGIVGRVDDDHGRLLVDGGTQTVDIKLELR